MRDHSIYFIHKCIPYLLKRRDTNLHALYIIIFFSIAIIIAYFCLIHPSIFFCLYFYYKFYKNHPYILYTTTMIAYIIVSCLISHNYSM